MSTLTEQIKTWAVLQEAKVINYNALIAKSFNELETLRSILKNDIKEPGVAKVIKMKEDEVTKLEQQAKDWLTSVDLKVWNDYEIIIVMAPVQESK
jgi:hypothetical protein